jgi:transcriptional regulator with XRE-family HTH domain
VPEKSIYTPAQKRLCALLRETRIAAGLTQEQLAERLGRPQSFVSKIESRERRLDLVVLREVDEALGVGLVAFVRRFDES